MSLRYLFNADGFRVERLEESFEGQFLCLEATTDETSRRPGNECLACLETLMRDVTAFFRRYTAKIAAWKCELERIAERGRKAAVWGVGSKGVSFLNTLKASSVISHVVDINPINRQLCARDRPGDRQPRALKDIDPDLIIIMNPIYVNEIWDTVKRMGLKCRILTA